MIVIDKGKRKTPDKGGSAPVQEQFCLLSQYEAGKIDLNGLIARQAHSTENKKHILSDF